MRLKNLNYIYEIELQNNGFYFGRVINRKDQITFQSKNPSMLMEEFRLSVEDYHDFCRSKGEKPEPEK